MRFWPKIKIICGVCLTIILSLTQPTHAQQLTIVSKYKTYWQKLQTDSLQKMIELKNLVPGLVYELRYATKNNFTHERLYRSGRNTFLRLPAARALKAVQQEFNTMGYGLKIFDAYRPYSVTKKMWDLVHDERYVADPSKGSAHNRGLAVDLTLIDLRTGKELDMGTGFDNFTDTAHHAFLNLPPDVLKNRSLLRQMMEKNGFHALETEWWHYSWPNDRNYDVMDISPERLERR
jgi:D-alanyl-D-alanine dipeptidase